MTRQNPHFSPPSPRRRDLLCTGLGLLAGASLPGFAQAAPAAATTFPKGPVKLIVPFAPGGPTDTVGRLIAMKLQESWGQPVIVDYKPGAGTAIGADFVAKAPPDGLTIGMVNSLSLIHI